MRLRILILSIISFIAGCQGKTKVEKSLKILSIITTDNIDDYNKGFALGNYFFYDFISDSIILRLEDNDPLKVVIFKGKLENKAYTDTLERFFKSLRMENFEKEDTVKHCYQPNCYCNGYNYCFVAKDTLKEYFIHSSKVNEVDLSEFGSFYYRLKDYKWAKKTVSKLDIDEPAEVVRILKGIGIYDSIIKRYSPLPCTKGIEMDKLYGVWRTIGDQYNDPTLKHWKNTIERNGNWTINYYNNEIPTLEYSGHIISISNNEIKVKSEHGIANLKVLNLTENCLEYIVGDKNIWRLDREK